VKTVFEDIISETTSRQPNLRNHSLNRKFKVHT
jgi:hypothetical protein